MNIPDINFNSSISQNPVTVANLHLLNSVFSVEKLKTFFIISLLSFLALGKVFGEGTKELAPNAQIDIDGNTTNDIAALNIGSAEYRFFAEYDKNVPDKDKDARLYIHITDPSSESIYLGFSRGHDNTNSRGTVRYKYYILDPAGNIVYTSDVIEDTNGVSNANIADWSQAFNGPNAFNGAGYNANVINPSDLTSAGNLTSGDYYIQFELLTEPADRFLLIDYWDITVVNDNTPKPGRIWSKNWGLFAINDFGFPNRPFNGAFYVCAPDPADPTGSYITKIDFNGSGFRPGGFNVTFNSFGTDLNLTKTESRKSVMGANKANPEYQIYLNDPIDICETAEAGMLNFNGVTRCDGQSIYCIGFLTDKPGTINLLLDFEGGDGQYTENSRDILLSRTIDMNGVGVNQCFEWNGLDGKGNLVDEIVMVLSYEQGEYHFPIYDAEYLTDGFMIERVRPSMGGAPKVFYDDLNITRDPYTSGTQPAQVQLDGCDAPCHNWDNYTGPNDVGFGNLNTINSWWFSNRIVVDTFVELPAVYSCSLIGESEICDGNETVLELNLDYSPSSSAEPLLISVTWDGPGIIDSNDGSATVNAEGTYTANIHWMVNTGNNGNTETCSSSCSFDVTVIPLETIKIDTTIAYATVFEMNGEVYDTSGTYTQNIVSANGCDGTLIICLVVETPDVTLICDINGSASGLCPGEPAELSLSTVHSPSNAPFPTILDVSWDGPGITASNNDGATVEGGGIYSASVTYENLTGEILVTNCSISIDEYPAYNVKVDTLIAFGTVFEANGITYDATGNYTQDLLTLNGCDSTVVYCVVVETPDVSLTCEINGSADGLCPQEASELSLNVVHSPSNAPFPTIVSVDWEGAGIIDSNDDGATIQGGGDYTSTITYVNLTGDTLSTTCSISIDEYPEYNIKVDTLIAFGTVFEANGMTYDATGNYTQDLLTVNGCDSTIVYCVVVEIPDVSITCELVGPKGLCEDERGDIDISITQTPDNAPAVTINSVTWSGSSILSSDNDGATIGDGGTYAVDISYTNVAGETRSTSCSIFVDSYPEYLIEIDTIIETGQTLTINGKPYDSAGEFEDISQTAQGCDSIVIIRIVEENVLLCYDLNDCKSSDYSKLTGKVADDFDCAHIVASTVYRVNPAVNAHSCTEGFDGENAMCISSVETCDFLAGNEKSAIIDVVISPNPGQNVRVTSMDFYERAPEKFQWIVGTEGLNNYPTMYGIRVLKNNQEIYRSVDQATSEDWTLERFRFSGLDEFVIDEPTILRFELLGYCTVGNDSHVTAWDLDEIKIKASCTSASANQVEIAGSLTNIFGEPISQVKVSLESDDRNLNDVFDITDNNGEYAFSGLKKGYDYQVKPNLNEDYLRGVTTADLILIQRHVLGLAPFESPYQMIAADANNSESISAIDILELRKLILGITEELPNNTSYRFVKADQELAISNPWQIEESEWISNADQDQMNVDFKAIKIGDVSSFVTAKGGTTGLGLRSNANAVLINAENVFVNENEIVQLELVLDNISEVEGFQFALDLGTAHFVSLDGLSTNGGAYHLDSESNVLKVSWISDANKQNAVELRLNLLANKSAWVSDMIKLNESVLTPLVYSGQDLNGQKLGINFQKMASSESISINPNPFSESFNIDLNSGSQTSYTIAIFDVSGKLLYQSQNELNKGMNTKVITKADIANYSGVIVIKVNSADSQITKRILSL